MKHLLLISSLLVSSISFAYDPITEEDLKDMQLSDWDGIMQAYEEDYINRFCLEFKKQYLIEKDLEEAFRQTKKIFRKAKQGY
jgi:hypothetical protein